VAFPMNWWLVANHLKHGMMTVRHPDDSSASPSHEMSMPGMTMPSGHAPSPPIPVMTALSFLVLAAGLLFAYLFGDFTPAHYHPGPSEPAPSI
ncbi:MAG TPA: hypothetical protein VFK86_16345, partial [Bauldia sp.]|nr:hypothetical protein [Bauldia sp.]